MISTIITKLTFMICIVLVVQRSFVEPAPVETLKNEEHEKTSIKNFDEVKQLEDLKNSFGKTFSVLKSHFIESSVVDGLPETHGEVDEEVNVDGKQVASLKQRLDTPAHEGGDNLPEGHVHTEVNIPSRGIHKVADDVLELEGQREVVPNVERRSAFSQSHEADNPEKYKSFSGTQYSPLDMAEYVFWTGDEKGVTLSIEELLQDGLMSREEAVGFLQEIRYNLDYLQSHYSQQQRFNKHDDQQQSEQSKAKAFMMQSGFGPNRPHSILDSKLINDVMAKKSSLNAPLNPTAVDQEETAASINIQQQQQQQLEEEQQQQQQQPQPQQQPPLKLQQQPSQQQQEQPMSPQQQQPDNLGISAEDYDELLERLKVADFLYTEYSLEEVIYQLAKVMFSQSLTKGSLEAQEALQKFTGFLEAEAEKGHISRSLEKKVLDVLIASLTDTLAEHPQLLSNAREGLGDPSAPSTQLLRQLVMMNPNKAQKAADGHQSTLTKGRDKSQPPQDKNIKPDVELEPATATKHT